MTVILLIGVVSVVIGAFTARWSALLVPPLLLTGFYAGTLGGWWGQGVGESWFAFAVLIAAVLMLGTGVAVAVARGPVRQQADEDGPSRAR